MSELPLPEYDELPLASLQHRIRSLDEEQLDQLMSYELKHANRLPVLELMRVRKQQLHEGAEPSHGEHTEIPEVSGHAGGSPASRQTAAEPNTPLRHGVADQTPHRGRR
ncbi:MULTISPECIES: hypothetical protein [Amycolatopsis]|uniref:DUF8129 domain-containing protein n=1 Tax=Amycolatopsis thermalba TaxID=944492 RepID=A0ABY4P3I8_9PSEU|nr:MULTISPECIES: hypothetical protein [Amycolatopsis]OXM71383.1 hypothetical protein CF166_19095 [Amycolatopsis sp. KNN50.9b]UQS26935.1 hypothetical protein L1857_31110 [Amycolatopsis thermalba]